MLSLRCRHIELWCLRLQCKEMQAVGFGLFSFKTLKILHMTWQIYVCFSTWDTDLGSLSVLQDRLIVYEARASSRTATEAQYKIAHHHKDFRWLHLIYKSNHTHAVISEQLLQGQMHKTLTLPLRPCAVSDPASPKKHPSLVTKLWRGQRFLIFTLRKAGQWALGMIAGVFFKAVQRLKLHGHMIASSEGDHF